ncbi:hypothetical protein KHQ82_10670 [Mycoplasmatota bacterium]|nr:hypothetical protein KHQ82_10670 [Mycoplasmatota bacterium]
MSYQEKRNLFNIVVSSIITVIYFIIINTKFQNGAFDTSNMLRFWAVVILIFIPVSVISRIIALILFRIYGAISDEVRGEKEDRDVIDERDKLIELKSNKVAQIIFILGFIGALFTLLFNASVSVFFILMLASGFVGELASNIMQIVYYRRGF